jgi:farnesyl-diphosphate farnesyltransferase
MATQAFLASFNHPSEILALLKYKYGSQDKTVYKELASLPLLTDPSYSYAKCYYYLNKTSRSFARVIQELDPELRHSVCIFYLVLRGLDTIEDDMTLSSSLKQNLLIDFHEILSKKGWKFDGNGPEEKDGILLVEFNVVIDEFLKLKEPQVFFF